MRIEENIGLLPKLEGWTEQQIKDKVDELLQLVSLLPGAFKRRYPRELSGGQQQRVGLARALALDAPLLLMDEPFGALDPILRRQLQNEFLRIKKELDRTIIFVTHDIEEAFTLGDRIAIMNKAKLIQVGEPNELLLQPADDFVVDMIDAKKKYKHIDSLSVKDMMIPLGEKYMLDASMNVRDAQEEMIKRDVELAVVVEKSRLVGYIVFKDLLTEKIRAIGDIAKQPIIFEKNHPMASALEELKKNNQSIAIVVEEQMPVGLLLSNEILRKMV
jgi:osmoprotectant transport system ATP-binding protein